MRKRYGGVWRRITIVGRGLALAASCLSRHSRRGQAPALQWISPLITCSWQLLSKNEFFYPLPIRLGLLALFHNFDLPILEYAPLVCLFPCHGASCCSEFVLEATVCVLLGTILNELNTNSPTVNCLKLV